MKRFSLTINYLTAPSLLDNITKVYIAANGTIPGPPIIVDEGDWVAVTVTNLMEDPTTIHWHGMLQTLTPSHDGVPGLTGCMIPGGGPTDPSVNTMTYAFRASLSGIYFYHGHALEQNVDGLFGPLIIRSPKDSSFIAEGSGESATSLAPDNLDAEIEQNSLVLMVSDFCASMRGKGGRLLPAESGAHRQWEQGEDGPAGLPRPQLNCPFHLHPPRLLAQPADNEVSHSLLAEYYLTPASGGNEPIPSAVQVNGQFTRGTVLGDGSVAQGLHVYAKRQWGIVRLVNAAAFSMVEVSIDGPVNPFLVGVDGTRLQPLLVPGVVLNVAQRSSLVYNWSAIPADVPAVWLRVHVMASMLPTDDIETFIPPYEAGIPSAVPLNTEVLVVVQFSPLEEGLVTPTYPPSSAYAPPPPQVSLPYPLDFNYLYATPVVPPPNGLPAYTHAAYMEIEFYSDNTGVNYGYLYVGRQQTTSATVLG